MMLETYAYLYVEDEPLSREIMQMIMVNVVGVRDLTIFEDSRDFVSRVKALPKVPDVIMLDIHVKPIDGFEMLALLRNDPAFSGARIIALTASVMNEEIRRLRTSGFQGAIGKPLSLQTFPDLLRRVVEGEAIWHIA